MSLCLHVAGELGFLIDPIGPGTRTLCSLETGDTIGVLGPTRMDYRQALAAVEAISQQLGDVLS